MVCWCVNCFIMLSINAVGFLFGAKKEHICILLLLFYQLLDIWIYFGIDMNIFIVM